jgi:hypothetical protein
MCECICADTTSVRADRKKEKKEKYIFFNFNFLCVHADGPRVGVDGGLLRAVVVKTLLRVTLSPRGKNERTRMSGR